MTRATEQAHELAHSLEALGAEVVLLPTVSFAAVENSQALDAALQNLAEFDWILFTSQNAVRFFSRRIRELNLQVAGLQEPRPMVAAVGTATASAATQEGFRVDTIPNNHSGEALAQELWGAIGDRKVLLPRSDRADDRLPKALREAGANVTEIVAYRTAAPDSLDPTVLKSIRDAEVDAIVFASPSAFRFLAECVGGAELAELSTRVQFAAIGPTTARALREEGMRVEIEASQSSAAGLADSIAKYYQRQHSAARPA
ncbi:MAG: uroporphyrinogen-III synthase [Candidatus Acidiferrales bacterium]